MIREVAKERSSCGFRVSLRTKCMHEFLTARIETRPFRRPFFSCVSSLLHTHANMSTSVSRTRDPKTKRIASIFRLCVTSQLATSMYATMSYFHHRHPKKPTCTCLTLHHSESRRFETRFFSKYSCSLDSSNVLPRLRASRAKVVFH